MITSTYRGVAGGDGVGVGSETDVELDSVSGSGSGLGLGSGSSVGSEGTEAVIISLPRVTVKVSRGSVAVVVTTRCWPGMSIFLTATKAGAEQVVMKVTVSISLAVSRVTSFTTDQSNRIALEVPQVAALRQIESVHVGNTDLSRGGEDFI